MFMKKFLLTVVAAGAMQVAVAQTAAVTNAIMYQRDGKLDKARTEIDKAITHSKTGQSAKTWFYRGSIYEQMINHPVFGKTAPDAPLVALESYDKAIALDKKNGDYYQQATQRKANIYNIIFNAGAKAYEAKDFETALKSFELAQQMKPQDTTAYVYAAFAAEQNQDFAKAKENYNKAVSVDPKVSVSVYASLINIALTQDKDTTQAMSYIEQARKAYPNNRELMLHEVNLYIKTGKDQEAIAKLQNAIAAEPTNSNLYAVLGSLYDQSGKPDLALAQYNKAVEVDPNNFDAQFNLGVYQFNKAAELFQKANRMDFATYQKQGAKLEAQAKQYFQKAIPHFEAALKINPKDRTSMDSLQKIYTRLGKNADAERINKMMEESKK